MPSKNHSYVELPESIPKCIPIVLSHYHPIAWPLAYQLYVVTPSPGSLKPTQARALLGGDPGPFSPKKIIPKH